MKYLKIISLSIIIYLIQISIIDKFSIAHVYPNLILITAIIFLLRSQFSNAIIFIISGGLLLDVSSNLRFGTYYLILLAIYLIYYLLIKKYISEAIFAVILIIFITASAIFELPAYLIQGRNNILFLYTVVYDTFLGIALYYLVDIITARKSKTYFTLD